MLSGVWCFSANLLGLPKVALASVLPRASVTPACRSVLLRRDRLPNSHGAEPSPCQPGTRLVSSSALYWKYADPCLRSPKPCGILNIVGRCRGFRLFRGTSSKVPSSIRSGVPVNIKAAHHLRSSLDHKIAALAGTLDSVDAFLWGAERRRRWLNRVPADLSAVHGIRRRRAIRTSRSPGSCACQTGHRLCFILGSWPRKDV